MQRDIKFRGIDIDAEEWVYGFYVERIDDHDQGYKIYDPKDGTWHRVKPETVGQFTGRKYNVASKEFHNDKGVYEGDIAKTESGRIVEVKFSRQLGWALNGTGLFRNLFIYTEVSEDIQKIGTIHTHPELLK